MSVTLHHGDCLDVLRTLPAESVDAVVTDPPYFRVKSEPWDRAWDKPALFLDWLGTVVDELARVLKPNGSLYLFASPRMAARVECLIAERMNVLNRIQWVKHDGSKHRGGVWSGACKEEMRSFFPQREEIIFAEQYGADSMALGDSGYAAQCEKLRGFVFEPLRKYLADEWTRAGLKFADANEACGTASMAARHFFSRSQWCLPTAEHYARLQAYANRKPGEYLRRDYEELRRDYEELRRDYEELRRDYEELRRDYEELRRPFEVSADVPFTDVWDQFPTVPGYPGKHVCEKSVALLEHMIRCSTKPGAVVLDCFAGSGATGVACLNLDRAFIGIEKADEWFRRMTLRLDHHQPNRPVYRGRIVEELPLFAEAGS